MVTGTAAGAAAPQTGVLDARFELLGPVRAWTGPGDGPRGGTEIELGPGKQRAVLAVLLLQAGTPVPTARVVDAVWGDEPPANGPNVVQKYVAGLRRALEPARSPRSPGQAIALTDGGYLLTVRPGAVDAARFDDVVRAGVAAHAAGQPDEAASMLREALDLWRGEPLAGLGGGWFEAQRRRLVDSRGLACEAWAAAELELGHHDRLAPELRRLADEFPLRERLRELLMLALYRSGRRAEALAVFRDTRELLVGEVGAEPGPALQDLFGRMLRSDPVLDPPAAAGPPARAPEPGAAAGPASGAGSGRAGRAGHARAHLGEPAAGRPAGRARPAVAPAARSRRHPAWGHVRRGLAVAVPMLSLGLLTWACVAFHAIARHSRRLGVAAGVYAAATFGVFVLVGSGPEDLPLWRDLVATVVWAGGLVVLGTAHVAALVHAPGREGTAAS